MLEKRLTTVPKAWTATRLWTWILVALGGIGLALAFPNEIIPGLPGDYPSCIIGWLALFPLMWAVFTLPAPLAVRASWVFGFTFWMAVLSWMRLFDLLPWLLLALMLSLTFPLIVWLMQRMSFPPWLSPLGLALAWTGVEWLRSQSLLGFSWGEIGASQIDGFPGRMASLGSVYLITFVMVWTTGTVTLWALKRPLPKVLLPVLCGFLFLCLLGGWWQTQLTMSRWQNQARAQVFSLMQPSVQKGLTPKALVNPISRSEQRRRLDLMLDLTRQSLNAPLARTAETPPVCVWPESAIPYQPNYVPDIATACREQRCYLLLGAPAYPSPDFRPRNAAYLIGPMAQEVGRYDKIHLVPFGEFVPMRSLVNGLRQWHIVPDVRSNDIISGQGWTPVAIGDRRFGIGICFESTFPAIARRYAVQGTQYLIYITNDAWFHRTSAVRQHFNHARFRALETGLPAVRVASTGISGFIAPNGTILEEIPTYASCSRLARLPEGTPGTVYTTIGWLFAPCCLLISLAFLVKDIYRKRRESSRKRTSADSHGK